MVDLDLVIYVIGMFFLRIGLPVVLLITLGTLVDRWQTRQERNMNRMQER